MTTNTHIAAQALRQIQYKAVSLADAQVIALEALQALDAVPALDAQGERTPRLWKVGNELLPFHKSASHVPPDYRDGWNACWYALKNDTSAVPLPHAVGKPLSLDVIQEWAARRVKAVGPEGITDPIAFLEEGVRWGEAQHGIITKESGNG